jgi:hypothetical protein
VRLLLEGIESEVVRLMVGVSLRQPDGSWSRTWKAIVDLGSPYCVIPHSIWSESEHRVLVQRLLRIDGIGGGSASGNFGEATLVVVDDTTTSPPITVRAFLLTDDSEPLLLGFEDFLTRLIIHSDYPHDVAYLEFPDTILH